MVSSTFFLLCLIGLSHEGTQKVFKGTECIPHSQLWQVGLFEGTQLRCGGVLIDRRWVLTAARCSNSRYSLSQMDWTKQIRHSGLSVTHPGYQAALQNQDNDLRLLQLGIPVPLTRSIRPLPLPTTCAVAGTRCHISGWGTTNHTRSKGVLGSGVTIGKSLRHRVRGQESCHLRGRMGKVSHIRIHALGSEIMVRRGLGS
ncbi:kallikrein-12 isoform X2 [Orcinus orca]|nr:kallikrein-12 isoform X2 [Orcinus orca]